MEPKGPELPLDHLQGVAPNGTPAFSNNFEKRDKEIPASGRFELNTFGAVGQCVQFARRYLYDTKAVWLPDITVANMIYYAPWVSSIDGTKIPTKSYRNGSASSWPEPGSLLIHASHFGNFPGHVAVIVRVDREQKKVYVACQNRHYKSWEGKDHSVVHDIVVGKNGTYSIIDDEEPIVGWVAVEAPDVPLPAGYEPPSSPKVLDRTNFSSLRPLPKTFDASKLPSYTSEDLGWSMGWWQVMSDFRPHPVIFPFFFVFMVTKFLIIYPLMHKIGLM